MPSGGNAKAENIGHVQHVVNKFADLLRDKLEFDGKSIYTIPRYSPKSMKAPFIHVFASETDYNDKGFQNKYKYALKITLIMVMPQQQIQNRARAIHRYEELIQDIMIRNRQVDLTSVGIRMQGWYITKAFYVDSPEDLGMQGVDTLGFDIECNYDRTVT